MQAIRFVLVEPSHAGNIGAAARALKNMGLRELVLVRPAAHLSDEARARAAGADDVLEAARVHASLDEALADCQLVIGTSARNRRIEWPALSPREAAARLLQEAAPTRPVALVFGRERTGLTNEEIDRCQAYVTIPTDPAFPSLNLAATVQIMAYELALADNAHPRRRSEWQPASQAEMRRLYEHLNTVLVELEFLDPANPRKLMRRLMRLFNRAELEQNEANILRGILTAVQRRNT